MSLFDKLQKEETKKNAPLADRMRPEALDDIVGQDHLLGALGPLRKAIEQDQIPSMIFWGPPGCGKTTLARVIAKMTRSQFIPMSATSGNVKEAREVIARAKDRLALEKKRTILFVDEIHRFSKSQQDTFLPSVEDGTITFIGATTENPSFEVISALLSRARVFVLKQLDTGSLVTVLKKAITDNERGLGRLELKFEDRALDIIASSSDGDARRALNTLEFTVQHLSHDLGHDPGHDPKFLANPRKVEEHRTITTEQVKNLICKTHLHYDQSGEEHYNIISALHKAMRGGDANAALYWLGRMLEAGEDPLYVARRLIRFASEDVGLADPRALEQAVAAYQACHFIGMPECNVVLAQCVAYLARAPKSNALYTAYNLVRKDIEGIPNEPVPIHLRNAPTKLMQELGYGKGYKYTPDYKNKDEASQDYLPPTLKNRRYLKLE